MLWEGSGRYVNQDAEELAFEDAVLVFGQAGAWGGPSYKPEFARSPDGARRAVSALSMDDDVISLNVGIQVGAAENIWDVLDPVSDLLRPHLADGSPNRGYLYFARTAEIAVPDEWRIPVAPVGFQWAKEVHQAKRLLRTDFRFHVLESSWQAATATTTALKAAGDPAWTSVTATITPGGNAECEPTWTIGGPSAGTITSVTIENATTGTALAFTGLSLGAGQTFTIETAFLRKMECLIAGVSQYSKRTAGSAFFWLRPGANAITVTKNASSQSAASVTYRKRRAGF